MLRQFYVLPHWDRSCEGEKCSSRVARPLALFAGVKQWWPRLPAGWMTNSEDVSVTWSCTAAVAATLDSFGREIKPRSSLCLHASQRTACKDLEIHILDGQIPATETHGTQNRNMTSVRWQNGLIIIIIMSVFLERLSMWNMLSCAEQVQIQK